jgi:hypothetical protein
VLRTVTWSSLVLMLRLNWANGQLRIAVPLISPGYVRSVSCDAASSASHSRLCVVCVAAERSGSSAADYDRRRVLLLGLGCVLTVLAGCTIMSRLAVLTILGSKAASCVLAIFSRVLGHVLVGFALLRFLHILGSLVVLSSKPGLIGGVLVGHRVRSLGCSAAILLGVSNDARVIKLTSSAEPGYKC